MRHHLVIALFTTAAASITAFSNEAASELFKINCSACHQVANEMKPIVGPSLVEINHIYQKDAKKFIDWCVAPGKKRADAIQMPSMAHIKKEDLAAIHGWMKIVTKGKKFVKPKKKQIDPHKLSLTEAKKPRIQRIFLPDTSPASMAITIDGENSLCWDTLSCRLRYVWRGGFIDGYSYWKGNGGSVAQIVGDVFYRAPVDLNAAIDVKKISQRPVYKGYKMRDGLPVFQYTMGPINVSETILNEAGVVVIQIKTSGVKDSLKYPLGDLSGCDFSHSKGKLVDGALLLNANDASEFKIRFSAKHKK
jgi:cytochrome c551/c552